MSEHQDQVPNSGNHLPPMSHHPPSSQQPQHSINQNASVAQAQATAAAAVGMSAVSDSRASSATSADLTCQWTGCGEKCASAEALYEHVCERHVGRKSTNNLNLTCQWGSCRTTTVKRDHITSHIRVHVPLKPHRCDFCGKTFKRPQDLKKHVKTHADDSVLVRTPDPNTRNTDVVFGGPGNPKGPYGPPNGHYFDPSINPMPTHGYHHGGPQYYQPPPPQHPQHSNGPTYGNVIYHNLDPDPASSYESKKRSIETLDEFFGDLKRNQIDPKNYAAIGQRLVSLHSLSVPLTTGVLQEYQTVPAAIPVGGSGGYGSGPAVPVQGYHLPPMNNIRTKNDLVNIDQFLEQMQATIYENPEHLAATGVGQPGATYVHGDLSYRTTHSPPRTQLASSHATATTSAPMVPTSAHSPHSGTSALTPPSSIQSHASERSPSSYSTYSSHRYSPPHGDQPGMYPRLPPTSTHETLAYPVSSSAAPPSTLSGVYDHDDRRRYTGGTLQRARPDYHSPAPLFRTSDDEDTPSPKKPDAKDSPGRFASNLIDPSLHRSNSPNETESNLRHVVAAAQAEKEEADREHEEELWIANVRLIEALRDYISKRLDEEDYEKEGSSTPTVSGSPPQQEDNPDDKMEGIEPTSTRYTRSPSVVCQPSLYPTLRGV